METSTLQKHLARGQQPDTGERRLYVLDESSLASTKQMHEFVNRLHPNDRVLLVGDRRQHEAVEAGRPFAQLQDAGMKTVKLEEIVRPKNPELKQVVEQLARGEVREAVQGLERQGRVHEIAGRDDRITAIAKEYAKSPEGTLVVSPDNRSRVEINERIRAEMQERGSVSKDDHRIHALVPRQDDSFESMQIFWAGSIIGGELNRAAQLPTAGRARWSLLLDPLTLLQLLPKSSGIWTATTSPRAVATPSA
jgi:ATP-dependent exoDNAse (exonuclease V) alpha subunit